MGKIRITVEVCMLTGDYEFKFENLTHPGESIDYTFIRRAIDQILLDLGRKVEAQVSANTTKKDKPQ